jgi:hypothetical protein
MQKQAAAITAKDFGDATPKPGTPVQRGEVIGADGKPIPYMAKKSDPRVDGANSSSEGSEESNGWAKVDKEWKESNGAPLEPVRSKTT